MLVNSWKLLNLIAVICSFSLPFSTKAFEYFDSPSLDYWKIRPKAKKEKEGKEEKPPFNWKNQLNPQKDAFFQEGSHRPPAAVVELMRHPTDENIKNWFSLIEKKNKITQRLHQKIAQYMKKHRNDFEKKEVDLARSNLNSLPKIDNNRQRFRFRLYFESTCSHCKSMMKTMKQLQDRGYYVELRQVDDDKKATQALPFPVLQATPRELSEKKINSWPVLLVGDLERKVVYRLNGYLTTQEVLHSLNR